MLNEVITADRLTANLDLGASAGVLQTVTDLDLAVYTGQEVTFTYALSYTNGNNIGIRLAVNCTGTGTFRGGTIQGNSTTSFATGSGTALNTVLFAEGAGSTTPNFAIVSGTFVATSDGTLSLQACNEGSGACVLNSGSGALFLVAGPVSRTPTTLALTTATFAPTVTAISSNPILVSCAAPTALVLATFAPTVTTSVSANDFTKDETCIALYRFETGQLLTDSKGSDTLSASASSPASSNAQFKEGAWSSLYTATSSQFLYRTDANLSSNFPLKSGTSNTTFSICLWAQTTGVAADFYHRLASKFILATNHFTMTCVIANDGGTGQNANFTLGDGGSGVTLYANHTSTLSSNTWYHLSFCYRDSDQAYLLCVRDTNGDLVGSDLSGTASGVIGLSATSDFMLGSLGTGASPEGGNYFDGYLDEVVVFSKFVTATDATNIAKGLYAAVAVVPTTLALTLATFAPTVTTPQLVVPTTLALTLTTYAPTVTAIASITVTPDPVALILTTYEPTVSVGTRVVPDTLNVFLTTYEPTVLTPLLITPETLGLVLTTFEPTVTALAGTTVVPDPLALLLATFAPTVTALGGGGATLHTRVIRGDHPLGLEDWMVSWNG